MKRDFTHRLGGEELKRIDRLLDLFERAVKALEKPTVAGAGQTITLDPALQAMVEAFVHQLDRLVGLYSLRKQSIPRFTFEGGFLMLFRLPSNFPNTLIHLSPISQATDAEGFPILDLSDYGVRLVSNNETAVTINPTDDPLVNEVIIVGPQASGEPNSAAVAIQVYQKSTDLAIGSIDGCVIEVHAGAPAGFSGGGADFVAAFGTPVAETAKETPPANNPPEGGAPGSDASGTTAETGGGATGDTAADTTGSTQPLEPQS